MSDIIRTTDALVIHDREDLRLDRVPVAAPGRGEVTVRVAWGGICGSDMHYLKHGGVGASVLRAPMILGHEISGFVEAAGPGVHGLAPGEAVAVHPARPCGECPECRRGLRHLCRETRFLGSAAMLPHTDGGFRRLMTVAASQVYPLPPGLDVRAACLAEPLSVALHAIIRAGDVRGRSVLVQGAGPIGALIVAGLKIAGAGEIVATDLQDFPLSIARRMGATTTVNTASAPHVAEHDIVFEVSGAAGALPTAIGCTAKGGVLVQVGMFPPGDVGIPLGQIIARELDYRGSFRFDTEFGTALDLLAAYPWIAEGLVTHRFPLAAFGEAFTASLDRRHSSKVLFDIGG
ncbi:L-idonate 5-dehydrogenase [Gluconacetobacter takamatsuzukensis]|uniref:L-idonate 5-dehydrogenase n=1 Tax=Gluconacetobacter takamatsuzukensis TaxID=1286190 RepID=A0A7W4PQZ9_9PROT|nr:L-idonate 5-dehydrogenase [Gluconacetobacter takamatsuzukensis]MBB2205029.1 L-idonate 5-dehydrogenase [Gluconacetobacter takamatsuzukensis]